MPITIKIQDPAGQQVPVVAHSKSEMDSFLSSIDLNKYTIEKNVFQLNALKIASVFSTINFRSSNTTLGAVGYNGTSGNSNSNISQVLNVTNSNSEGIYFLEIVPGTGVDTEIKLKSGTNGNMTTGGSGDAILKTDNDWRQVRIHKITTIQDYIDNGGAGGNPNFGDDYIIPDWGDTGGGDTTPLGSGQVYAPLFSEDILTGKEIETGTLWSDSEIMLTTPATNSAEPINNHKLDVYNDDPLIDDCAEIQFSIIYGDYDGLGDVDLGGLDFETLSKAMYSQYRNILLPQGQEKFIINGQEQDYVYVIDIKRDRYKSSLDVGNWELTLCDPTDSSNYMTFIDDSVLSKKSINFANKVYSIKSGSRENGLYFGTGSASGSISGSLMDGETEYGLVYPNQGMLVFSGELLDVSLFLGTDRTIENDSQNPLKLFNSMKLVVDDSLADDSGDLYGFYGRYVHLKYNKLCFVRVKSQQFNHSNNPTFVTGSEGDIIETMDGQNKAYFTSIGLYNSAKELLAVGKISKAIKSTMTDESLFTVKIGH